MLNYETMFTCKMTLFIMNYNTVYQHTHNNYHHLDIPIKKQLINGDQGENNISSYKFFITMKNEYYEGIP